MGQTFEHPNLLSGFRDIMLTEGTEPRAWAPAEGEVWPE